jgi:hypothetical protein
MRPEHPIYTNRDGVAVTPLDSFSECTRLESRPGYRLTEIFLVFLLSLQENSSIVPRLGHDYFLSNPLQFTIINYPTIRRHTVYILRAP